MSERRKRSMSAHILIVEDEKPIREMLRFALSASGNRISEAADTQEADQLLEKERPDLILLDWMLPGLSGVDYAKRLSSQDSSQDIPIIMLTARAEEESKINGLDAGVDDYITKPFSTRELLARIKAVLRRSNIGQREYEAGRLRLNTESQRVTIDGETIDIGPTEYRLLKFFISHPERVYARGQLLDQVWGTNVYVEDRTVDVHIRRLRKILEPSGLDCYIQTVRGSGYRFSSHI